MPNQTSGTNANAFNPDCHRITVFCKRVDRALERIAKNNTLLFTATTNAGKWVTIIRYSLPLIHREKYVDNKGHKFRVAGAGDNRYLPISYGRVGSRGCSGICWSADIRINYAGTSTTEYSDQFLYCYPQFTEYPLTDFVVDHDVELRLLDQLLLKNVGIFIDSLHDGVDFKCVMQYKEDVDSIPQLLANPRNSMQRVSQIIKDHFGIDVGVDAESTIIKQLPNN